jgi:NADH dehydrogenase
MATVGRRAAIADIALIKGKSLKLTGSLAWLAWLFVHIVMLLGNRNRLATLVNLTTKYLAPSRRTNPIVGDVPVFEPQMRPDEGETVTGDEAVTRMDL